MQISNSYSSSLSSSTRPGSANYDYSSTKNTLFQNLLHNAAVQDNVTLNENGSYSWQDNANGSVLSAAEGLTKSLIGEQNGTNQKAVEGMDMLTPSDVAKFHEMTGYDLVQVGIIQFVVDDSGNPVPTEDNSMAKTAWDAITAARSAENLFGTGSDLSSQQIADALTCMRSTGQANWSVVDDLLGSLG